MAQAQAARAVAARDFLASVLVKASPEGGGSPQATVREVLDRARTRIRDELGTQPELRTEMSTLIGRTYNDLGEYEQGLPLLREAAATDEGAVSTTTRAEAHVELARALLSRNANVEAERECATAVALLRAGPPSDALASALATLGTARYLQNRYADALAAQRESTQIVAALHTENGEAYASSLLELSYFLISSNETEQAVDAAQRSLRILDDLHPGENHPAVARALWALGNALSAADRDAEAVPHLRRARDMVVRIYGRDGNKYMRSLQLLGTAELFAGDVAAARTDLAETMRLLQANAPEHPIVPVAGAHYATALLRNGESAAAADAARQVLDAARRAHRDDAADQATVVGVRALLALGNASDALAQADSALPTCVDADRREWCRCWSPRPVRCESSVTQSRHAPRSTKPQASRALHRHGPYRSAARASALGARECQCSRCARPCRTGTQAAGGSSSDACTRIRRSARTGAGTMNGMRRIAPRRAASNAPNDRQRALCARAVTM
jgi:serine/threonine-protein kinase